MPIRENAKLLAVAVVCLLLAWSGPSIAHGVHARFAHNADKVDGRHAVRAGVGLEKAKGKLVAHDRNGRLPARFLPKSLVTEREYAERPGSPLLAAGFVASNGMLPASFFSVGTWDAVRTGTGTYRIRLRAPEMCDASLWPVLHLTGWHSQSQVTASGVFRSCDTDAYSFTVLVRDASGARVDADWGFTVYGLGSTIGPVSAARAIPRDAVGTR